MLLKSSTLTVSGSAFTIAGSYSLHVLSAWLQVKGVTSKPFMSKLSKESDSDSDSDSISVMNLIFTDSVPAFLSSTRLWMSAISMPCSWPSSLTSSVIMTRDCASVSSLTAAKIYSLISVILIPSIDLRQSGFWTNFGRKTSYRPEPILYSIEISSYRKYRLSTSQLAKVTVIGSFIFVDS